MTGAEVLRLEVSDHALRRYAERVPGAWPGRAEAELVRMAAEGKEVVPPAGWALGLDIDRRHDPRGEGTRYVRSGGFLLVLRERGPELVVMTIYRPDPRKEWWW